MIKLLFLAQFVEQVTSSYSFIVIIIDHKLLFSRKSLKVFAIPYSIFMAQPNLPQIATSEFCTVKFTLGFFVPDKLSLVKNIKNANECVKICLRNQKCTSADFLETWKACAISSTTSFEKDDLITDQHFVKSKHYDFECKESKCCLLNCNLNEFIRNCSKLTHYLV